MKIELEAWAVLNYDPPPSTGTLRAWIRTGQIIPSPEKVGRIWMVDEMATRMPLSIRKDATPLSKRALEILHGTTTP